MPEYVCAFEITRTFEPEELEHDPDPYAVMGILVRQVEHALRTVNRVTFKRLQAENAEGRWIARNDGSEATDG